MPSHSRTTSPPALSLVCQAAALHLCRNVVNDTIVKNRSILYCRRSGEKTPGFEGFRRHPLGCFHCMSIVGNVTPIGMRPRKFCDFLEVAKFHHGLRQEAAGILCPPTDDQQLYLGRARHGQLPAPELSPTIPAQNMENSRLADSPQWAPLLA